MAPINIKDMTLFRIVILVFFFDAVLSLFLKPYSGYIKFVLVLFVNILLLKKMLLSALRGRFFNYYALPGLLYIVFFLSAAIDIYINRTTLFYIAYSFSLTIGFCGIYSFRTEFGVRKEINIMFVSIIGFILSFLSLVDYFIDFSKYFSLMGLYGYDAYVYYSNGIRRVTGFMTPTAVFMFLFPSIVSVYIAQQVGIMKGLVFYIFLLFFLFASILSMSRAPQMLTSVAVLIIICDYYFRNGISVRKSIYTVFLLLFFLYYALGEYDVYLGRLEDFNSYADVTRYMAWENGIQLFADIYNILGNGHSSTSVSLYRNGMSVPHYHYESTFFYTFYESGLLGLFLRFAPVLYLIYLSAKINYVFLSLSILYMINLIIAPVGTTYVASLGLYLSILLISAFRERLLIR